MSPETSRSSEESTDLPRSSRAELPRRIRRLIETIETENRLTPATARRLLEQSGITAADLAPWADFDHPAADSYGRNMIHDGGCFELMAMSWAPGDMAAIHDHGYTQWGAVKLLGRAEHAIFKLDGDTLTTAERRTFEPGTVVAVGHDLIHQMGNPGAEPFLSLHLYGCPGRDRDVTADARLYELDEETVQITTGGVFFALPDGAVDRREAAPVSDFPTRLRYKVELLRRLLAMDHGWSRGQLVSPRATRLAGELFAPEIWAGLFDERERMRRAEPLRRARLTGILHQELYAAARLQFELIETGLVDRDLCGGAHRLAGLLALEDLRDFATGYLELIEESCPVAA